jgi:hypothetical protein
VSETVDVLSQLFIITLVCAPLMPGN